MMTSNVKLGVFKVLRNEELAPKVYKMQLEGDCSAITASGQFVNLMLEGKYLRRPISVCDVEGDLLTLVYKVVGSGTEQMSSLIQGEKCPIQHVYSFFKPNANNQTQTHKQQDFITKCSTILFHSLCKSY